MIVPAGVAGTSEISIRLVGEDGTMLAEAKTVLVIQAPAAAAPAPATAATPRPPPEKGAEPFAPPRAPVLSPAEREAAERLVARGEREIEQGNVANARQFFLRAAQAGLARGALLLAATYDPRELARWRVQGTQPNLGEARKWYERARELGAPEAEERLARLGGG
jgi:TPR repeat protein